MSYEKFFDQKEDGVDPRVQVELERLNSSTDEINKLEVDLDEARNQFRQLLQESTSRIQSCSRKLGSCIAKVRPYYDARMRAKEALQETQKAAVNFERANSAHAAAKEMVYLAEEGLKAEGRTFDHAWQEMLNHATMRVNESEAERTRCESEHRKTSQYYQITEMKVHALEKELKRAITKSRPYFELKIHYNQLLEKQKKKVKNLEKQVSEVKLNYAHTLKNLEQISDEIHKTRQKNKHRRKTKEAKHSLESISGEEVNSKDEIHPVNNESDCAKITQSFHAESEVKLTNPEMELSFPVNSGGHRWIQDGKQILSPVSESHSIDQTRSSTVSSQPDADFWSESSDGNLEESRSSENDSSLTDPPNIGPEDDTFKVSGSRNSILSIVPKVNSKAAPVSESTEDRNKKLKLNLIENLNGKTSDKSICPSGEKRIFEGVGICSFPIETELNVNFDKENRKKEMEENQSNSGWTEIKLRSPEEEIFSTVKKLKREEEEFDLPPHAFLVELQEEMKGNGSESAATGDGRGKNGQEESLCPFSGRGKRKKKEELSDGEELIGRESSRGTPKKQKDSRRQSLDLLWNMSAGEKVKEILSQSIMKLNISSLTEKKSNEDKFDAGSEYFEGEKSLPEMRGNDDGFYESHLSSQFGMNFFSRRNSKAEADEFHNSSASDGKKKDGNQDSGQNQIGGLIFRKERFFAKKVPSPLEKSFFHLNADEESNSDSDSLTSLDVLTDEQLSSLVLDKDLTEIYQDII